MTVKELIELLKQYNEEDEINLTINDDGEIYIEGFGEMWVEMEINDKMVYKF